MQSPIDRPLPYNIQAEEAVLGSLCIAPEFISKVAWLKSSDFYREKHQWIFKCIMSLHESGAVVDSLTLVDELERVGRLKDVGGVVAVTALMLSMPTALHVEHYGRIVKKDSTLRQLIGAAEKIAKMAHESGEKDIHDIISMAEREIFSVTHTAGKGVAAIDEILRDFYESVEELHMGNKPKGTPTGFKDLDHLLGGFQSGDLIILAARPSVGKTALAISILESMATKYQARIALFSLEMGVEQVAQRLISSRSGIDAQRLRLGPIYEEDLHQISIAVDELSKTRVFVDETPAISPVDMSSKLRRIVNEYGLDLVIVDYLQLMSSGRSENRVQEVSYISRMLKELARELKVPVLALSQLSRGVESRQDKRPMLSDLRASGSIEQDADIVMFIYRDEVYDKETEFPGIAEIIVSKHRNGPTGTVELRFTKENAKFTDLEDMYYDEEEYGIPAPTPAPDIYF